MAVLVVRLVCVCVSVCICLCARCIQVRRPNSASFLAALAMFHLCTFRIPCKHENGRAVDAISRIMIK